MSQLEAAMTSQERGNHNSARDQLGALFNRVEAQRGKRISEGSGGARIDQAQEIPDAPWGG
jgi:hypothetical protein